MHARAHPPGKSPNVVAEEQFPAAEEWRYRSVCYRKPVATANPPGESSSG